MSLARLWLPSPTPAESGLNDCLREHALYLEIHHPELLAAFKSRQRSAPTAALAEAVVFSWLDSMRLSPSVQEDRIKGGPDFLCAPSGHPAFAVEVTSLEPQSLRLRTGLPEPTNPDGAWVTLGTEKLASVISSKNAQLEHPSRPGLLAVCVHEPDAALVTSALAAELLLGAAPDSSAFSRRLGDCLSPTNTNVAAVLLVGLDATCVRVRGVLHPTPVHPIDYRAFPRLPFVRSKWPLDSIGQRPEWVTADPEAAPWSVVPVPLRESGLRG